MKLFNAFIVMLFSILVSEVFVLLVDPPFFFPPNIGGKLNITPSLLGDYPLYTSSYLFVIEIFTGHNIIA
jgi:hypothetical protein